MQSSYWLCGLSRALVGGPAVTCHDALYMLMLLIFLTMVHAHATPLVIQTPPIGTIIDWLG